MPVKIVFADKLSYPQSYTLDQGATRGIYCGIEWRDVVENGCVFAFVKAVA